MLIKTKSGKKIILPSPAEDEEITRAAMSDPDALPFTDAELSAAEPHMIPGRTLAHPTKERISIRLTRSVVETFRASGTGWQARLDTALQDWLKEHPWAK